MVHALVMMVTVASIVKMKKKAVLLVISKPVVGNVFPVMRKVGMLLLKANAQSVDHSVKCAVVHVFWLTLANIMPVPATADGVVVLVLVMTATTALTVKTKQSLILATVTGL